MSSESEPDHAANSLGHGDRNAHESTLPDALGPLAIGASATVTLTLNVPSTVTRLSLTEPGNMPDAAANSYNYSIAQTIIP